MARVIDLQEQTEITEDAYILTDNATTGTHKFNLKQLYDDSQRAIVSAQTAANSASSAAATAREVAASAQSVASEAESVVDGAAETLATAAERVDAAIDAMGDISELAVPEMSSDVRGGAKLDADGGLALRDGALGVGSLVQESEGAVRGGIASLTAKGHAEQVSTTGKNLLPRFTYEGTAYGITYSVLDDGSVRATGTSDSISVNIMPVVLGAGTYVLSGCPSGGTIGVYYMYAMDANGNVLCREIGSGATFTIAEEQTVRVVIDIRAAAGNVNLTFYPQLEAGSTATDYEPYSNGPSPSPNWPQEIQVTRGRNLLGPLRQVTGVTALGNSISFAGVNRDLFTGTTGADTSVADVSVLPHLGAGTYCLSYNKLDVVDLRISAVNDDGTINSVIIKQPKSGWQSYTFTLANPTYVTIRTSNTTVVDIQLELGSTATPYVPYGHVGMEVWQETQVKTLKQGAYSLSTGSFNPANSKYVATDKVACEPNVTYEVSFECAKPISNIYMIVFNGDALVSTPNITSTLKATLPSNATHFAISMSSSEVIAPSDVSNIYVGRGVVATTFIPLPSRGWVGSLPDGTADVLRLDGAGKVEWELVDAETATAATDGVTGTVGVDVLSTTGQIADGATVLYKLATPVTEDCGYCEDWPTDIPEGATVTIPELDEVGIRYFVDSAVTELAKQWYARANSEYSDRIAALEQAVAELATS